MKRSIFVIGTTAEWIKIQSVIALLPVEKVVVINTGQHLYLHRVLQGKEFQIVSLWGQDFKGLRSSRAAFLWFLRSFFELNKTLREITESNPKMDSVVVVHGDTITSLLGSVCSRVRSLQTLHIEAGLRSGKLLHPFPEELVRKLVSKFIQIHFAPDQMAINNLRKNSGLIVNTFGNTFIDSYVPAVLNMISQDIINPREQYALVSLHRQELIHNRKLVIKVLKLIVDHSKTIKFVIIVDNQFARIFSDLEGQISKEFLKIVQKLPHKEFVHLCINAQFVITDSGGTQEENAILGVPTLIFRKATERMDGLGKNIVLCRWDLGDLDHFFKNYSKFRRDLDIPLGSPSKTIAQVIREL